MKEGYDVYLAGPWFHEGQPERLEKVEKCLDNFIEKGLSRVFSPRRETLVEPNAQMDTRKQAFLGNVRHVSASDFIVAIVDGDDKGTLFECGLAYGVNVPILYYYEGDKPFNLMLAESCEELGYVTNIEDLEKRIKDIIKNGIDNIKPDSYKGEIE